MPAEREDLQDPVVVHNLGDKPIKISLNSRTTVIEPGESGIVYREAAIAWFGDPALSVEQRSPNGRYTSKREAEYHRLRGLYGAQLGRYEEHRDGTSRNADQLWEANRPRVKVTEQDGTEWNLVIDNPEGAGMVAPQQLSQDERIRLLEEQLASLKGETQQAQAPVDDDRPRRKTG